VAGTAAAQGVAALAAMIASPGQRRLACGCYESRPRAYTVERMEEPENRRRDSDDAPLGRDGRPDPPPGTEGFRGKRTRTVSANRWVTPLLPRGQFARRVAVLAGGTALGQAVSVLASPVLTRLYAPADFGVLAVYASILGIVSVVASLRYETAIPLPEAEADAANTLALSLGVVLAMSLLVTAGVWLLGDQIVRWVNAPALRPYVWLLPPGVAMGGVYQVLSQWAVRRQAFQHLARTKLSQGAGAGVTQIGLGVLHSGPLGLLCGQIVGQTAGTTTLLGLVYSRDKETLRAVTSKQMRVMAARYQRFPKLASLAALINATGLQAPLLALSALHGSQVAGWFALTAKVLGAPLGLIGNATAQVMYGQAAESARSGNTVRSLFWGVLRRQACVGLPVLVVAPVAPFLFPFLFGKEWGEAGLYAAVLVPALVAQFIAMPTGVLLDAMERQDLFLYREAMRLLLVGAVALVAVVLKLPPIGMIALFSLAMVVFAFLYAGCSLYAITHEGTKPCRQVGGDEVGD